MDRQIERLAARMRDEGVNPPRDLWPDIEARLEDRPASGRFRHRDRWWRLAAVAAALILLVGSGYFTGGEESLPPGAEVAAVAAPERAEGGSLLQMMNDTIGELEKAQALAPENMKLSRLTVLAHQGRAELLRAATLRAL